MDQEWPDDVSSLHHWATLKKVLKDCPAGKTFEKIAWLEELATTATSLYEKLREKGVEFDPNTSGNHLRSWTEALERFKTVARIRNPSA